MAEWLKAHAWKACVRETVPWVRIPLSPPAKFGSPYFLAERGQKSPAFCRCFPLGEFRRTASVALDRGWRMHFSPQPLYQRREVQLQFPRGHKGFGSSHFESL